MENGAPKSSFAAGVTAMLAAGALAYFGTGLLPVWWAMWLAPIPVLWFAGRPGVRGTFWVALGAWVLGALTWWHYLRGVLEIPLIICLLALLPGAVVFALCVLLWRRFLMRGDLWPAAAGLPVAWCAMGFLGQQSSPNSTFGNIAYSQMNLLPVIQIAAVTGIWGITFLMMLAASAVGVVLHAGKRAASVAITVIVLTAAVLGFGAWRLHQPLKTTGTIKAQLMTNDVPRDVFAVSDGPSTELLKKYTLAQKRGDADIIVYPEKIAKFSEIAAPQARQMVAEAAKTNHAYVVAGLDEMRNSKRRNDAVLYTPDGQLLIDYEKHHFVPGIEIGYEPGADYAVQREASGVWGVTICKDMDFPEIGRAYGQRGVGVLLVPAWDFIEDDWLHARMAILRGVESGFTIVRAAKQGLLSVSDNRGRILAEQRGSRSGMVSVEAEVPVAHGATVYARWGEWFEWLCVAGLAGLLVAAFWKPVDKHTGGRDQPGLRQAGRRYTGEGPGAMFTPSGGGG